ncbi:hypothetical protein CIL05_11350 [Virgibacillus profundi]|uniref:Isoprenylcysteine carboxyl methyltransferase n=1 Tax=Virgibacillus profundi TaxID=2024555 RepID=A0A2A2IDS0_9BACI|nr:isoprenylcysteine carboxylmethyltransferase family protein [Virgibacillus profundi]PAV29456.1 hypothetical protein CIL05_11350 [Virgibacillus profundi]PXY53625.1 hypothetical protein CIT14_11460 [Virgibacillus profundi]
MNKENILSLIESVFKQLERIRIMAVWIWLFIIYIGFQKYVSFKRSKKNEQWMKERGGIENVGGRYKLFLVFYILFYFSTFFEFLLAGKPGNELNVFFLFMFVVTQFGRLWCIRSLGYFWNMKDIIMPGVLLLRRGPYKYTKNPETIVTVLEMFILPLLIGAYITAFISPLLYMLLLKIPLKEMAVTKASV